MTDSDCPTYLKNLLVHNKRLGRYDNLRSNDGELLIVPYVKYKIFVAQAFSVSGPRLWNSLPMDIPNTEDIDTFKSELKTYLFPKFVVNELQSHVNYTL